jgi:hypothetical protein
MKASPKKDVVISAATRRRIVMRAEAHVLNGGGILPDHGGSEWTDAVGAIADEAFGAERANAKFSALIKDFDYDQHEALYTAVWQLINAHQDAAFAFGAAVGMQLVTPR